MACEYDSKEMVARTEDEKVLFEELLNSLQSKERASNLSMVDQNNYSRLATTAEIAPLVTAAFEAIQPKGKRF
jgi:hypothetical protein